MAHHRGARRLGLAHLTVLSLTPPELVSLAADVGYEFVGIRVRPASPGERVHPMTPGSPMVRETRERLASTGVSVLEIESLVLDESTTPADWRPMLQVGQELGASALSVLVSDEDIERAKANFGQLGEESKQFGMVPCLEPITYRKINSLPGAASFIAGIPNARIVLDVLHYARFGGTIAELETVRELIEFVQLCDGPTEAPTAIVAPGTLPLGQTTGGSALQLEARGIRFFPGEGSFELPGILAVLPDSVPVSVEIPNVSRAEHMGSRAYVTAAFEASRKLLGV